MAFQFVVSNGPKVPKDAALRTMIRKQAMKDVAIERRKRSQQYKTVQKGSNDSHTGSTSPDSTSTGSSDSSPSDDSATSSEVVCWQSSSPDQYADWFWNDMQSSFLASIIANPLSAYEQVCLEHNVTLDDLSGLTLFGVCSPIVPTLQDQKLLESLLGHKLYSYLRFVPSRYGMVSSITAAVDCVLAKAACRTRARNSRAEAQALSLYSKALREVQDCVRDEVRCKDADTMCAIMLLCLYELLDSTTEAAYVQHVHGLSQIAKHRQAPSFKSDYEVALLYGSLGSVVLESIMAFEHSHLAAPEWQDAIKAFAEESTWLTQRSPITVRMRLAETHLPGLISDVNAAVNDRTIFDAVACEVVKRRTAEHHQELLNCLEMYQAHLMQVSLLQPPQSELDIRRELLGSVIEHLCIVKRLLGILTDSDRARLEAENHALCLLLDDIAKQPGPKHAWLFNSHEHSIIEGIRLTKDIWAKDFNDQSKEEQQNSRILMWQFYFADLSKMATQDLDVQSAYDRMRKVQAG